MRKLKMSVAVAAAALTTLTLAGGASALTLKEGETTCALGDVTFAGMSASACEGAYPVNESSGNKGNSSGEKVTSSGKKGNSSGKKGTSNLDGIFGVTGWTELVKLDAPSRSAATDDMTLSVSQKDGDGTSGSWSVSGWGGHDTVMAVLKGGPSFAAYMFDTLEGTEGTWSMDGLGVVGTSPKAGKNPRRGRSQGRGPQRPVGIVGDTGGNTPDLSHFTLYSGSSASEPPVVLNPPAVPLPAAVWLLLSACAGLMMLRRRAA